MLVPKTGLYFVTSEPVPSDRMATYKLQSHMILGIGLLLASWGAYSLLYNHSFDPSFTHNE